MNNVEIKNIEIAQLRFAEYNPRKISEDQFARLRESIRAFGLTQPIIVNMKEGREYVIVGGHQRARAASMEGYMEVPCAIVYLNPTEEKTLNLALNRISGEWDRKKVGELLIQLNEEDAPIRLSGFEDDEVSVLIDEQMVILPTEEENNYEDMGEKRPEDPAECQYGELYDLGPHRLYCGDPNDAGSWSKLLDGEKADVIFGYFPSCKDDVEMEEYEEGIGDLLANMAVFSKEDAPIYQVMAWDELQFMQGRVSARMGGYSTRAVIVAIHKPTASSKGPFQRAYSAIPYIVRNGSNPYYNGEDSTDVWGGDDYKVKDGRIDPVLIETKALLTSSKRGHIVVDPNAGAATVLIEVCHKLGRRAFLIEPDPYKCDEIVKKWESIEKSST